MIEGIKIYSAPLQGYTDHIWRNAHAKHFGGVDVYCAPFARVEHGEIKSRDIRDIAQENNKVECMRPQILACAPDDALMLANKIKESGYTIIDINLGCPHPPIALKHKGAGMLKYPIEVAQMLEKLATIEGIEYTVKMRLGWDDCNQWKEVLDCFDIIKPKHVAVHPRIGKQQYKGELLMDGFTELYHSCHCPIIYNGEILSAEHIMQIKSLFPGIEGVMVGRGFVATPFMLSTEQRGNLMKFHAELLEQYSIHLSGGDMQILNKMKSLWTMFLPQVNHKLRKAISKSRNLDQYVHASTEAIKSVIDT